MDTHLDMTQEIQKIIRHRENDEVFRAVVQGDPSALAILNERGSRSITIPIDRDLPIGPRQVQSLLKFVINKDTGRQLEEVKMDNIVYDGLKEHRILGRKKIAKSRIAV